MIRLPVLGWVLAGLVPAPLAADDAQTLPGGAHWAAEMPAQWNGTLLLWSRGYSMRVDHPVVAPAEVKAALLAQGYALAASNYGSGGWALEQAVPAQLATLDAFAARYGKPKRTIAWGNSMGGLITTALAEQWQARIDGGIAMCSSIGGSLGMMNMALDGALAFRTLVAPDAGIALTGISDDRANGAKVSAALDAAMKTPEGRARVALAGVLAGIPGWTSRDRAKPDAVDFEAQADEIGRSFVMGVFLPRCTAHCAFSQCGSLYGAKLQADCAPNGAIAGGSDNWGWGHFAILATGLCKRCEQAKLRRSLVGRGGALQLFAEPNANFVALFGGTA